MAVQRISLLALVLVANVLAGCNTDRLPTFPVSGRVQFEDGEPVRFGSIEFYNREHDLTARGTINSNGLYELATFKAGDGAVEGEHQVVIIQTIMPTPVSREDPNHPSHTHHHGRHVDKKYAAYATSKLTCTVKKGNNTCNLTLGSEN